MSAALDPTAHKASSATNRAPNDQRLRPHSTCVSLEGVCIIGCVRATCIFLGVAFGGLRTCAFVLLQDLEQLAGREGHELDERKGSDEI